MKHDGAVRVPPLGPAVGPVAWTCPNCGVEVLSPFCPSCGERPLHPIDLRLRNLLAKLVHALTSIDGRLLRTVRQLLCHPGKLTQAFLAGQRKPYIAPFQLFVLANVLFFAVQSLTGVNVFSASLQSHREVQDWSLLATALVDQRLASSDTSIEDYGKVFDRAVVVNAKSLIILMAMPFAAVCSLAFLSSRKPFMAHVVFSLHLYTLLLLLFSITLLGVAAVRLSGGPGIEVPWVDNVISSVLLATFAIYLHLAAGSFFGARGLPRVAKVAALTVSAGALVLGYRFALFLITLYATT